MDINITFKEMAQYKRIIEEAKAEYEKRAAEVKAHMAEEGIDTLIGDEHKATYKEQVRNTFDSTAFKKTHADMYEEFKKTTTLMRFDFA